MRLRLAPLTVVIGLFWFGSHSIDLHNSYAQEQASSRPSVSAQRIAEFADYLSNSRLSGVFTSDGQPLDRLHTESYEIKSARKIEGEDTLWEIVARIKSGGKDIELPIEINIEWVEKSPVMVLEATTIPGLGTFSARVVFYDKKYAGIWKHDDRGGHLFGRVEKMQPNSEK